MFILVYIFAVCASNLSAAHFGLWVTPINAFVLIGLELVVRDVLHHKLTKTQMLLVVAVAGVLSFMINIDAKNIAIASLVAVIVSCFVDYIVYTRVCGNWSKRSNASNFFSGLSDSLIFPVIAFGIFIPEIFLLQWSAKFFGGLVWIYLLNKLFDIGRLIAR